MKALHDGAEKELVELELAQVGLHLQPYLLLERVAVNRRDTSSAFQNAHSVLRLHSLRQWSTELVSMPYPPLWMSSVSTLASSDLLHGVSSSHSVMEVGRRSSISR